MSVNKYIIPQNNLIGKTINVPFNINWNYLDLDQSIDLYEEDVIKQVIGVGNDFEVSRFAHDKYGNNERTDINYEFYFNSGGGLDQITNWSSSYINRGFTNQDIYYRSKSFKNSFFKLDLYDSPNEQEQVNYLTMIITTQGGEKVDSFLQTTPIKVNIPKFKMDYVGNVDGFFIYWLKKREFLNVDTFYMSAKFFDAKNGKFIPMMTGSNDPLDTTNGPQSKLGNKFIMNSSDYFYYRVNLDYDNYTYKIFNTYGQRVGGDIPIKWFEYVNP
jgi:hypothetical protein